MKRLQKTVLIALLICTAFLTLCACREEEAQHTHTFAADWTSDATHHWHAADCEHTEESDGKDEHAWDAGSVTAAPTCAATGVTNYTCTVCKATRTESVAALPHTYQKELYLYTVEQNTLMRTKCCDVCSAAGDKVTVENAVIVTDQTTAQAALDAAADNTTLYLTGNTNYGTLYLRTTAESRPVNVGNWAGGGNMYYRAVKRLTIVGGEGAVLDALDIEDGTYTPSGNQHSQSSTRPHLRSFIDIEALTLKGVTFSGAATALDLSGQVRVNGLTIDDCDMTDTGDSRLLYRQTQVYTYTDLLTNTVLLVGEVKNVAITNCRVTGAYMVAELRGMENILISGNTFTTIADRVLLLAVQDVAYSGHITVTNNTVIGAAERFLRADSVDANITVTGNTVTNYTGADTDIVKITNLRGTATVENNVWDAALTVTVTE